MLDLRVVPIKQDLGLPKSLFPQPEAGPASDDKSVQAEDSLSTSEPKC